MFIGKYIHWKWIQWMKTSNLSKMNQILMNILLKSQKYFQSTCKKPVRNHESWSIFIHSKKDNLICCSMFSQSRGLFILIVDTFSWKWKKYRYHRSVGRDYRSVGRYHRSVGNYNRSIGNPVNEV